MAELRDCLVEPAAVEIEIRYRIVAQRVLGITLEHFDIRREVFRVGLAPEVGSQDRLIGSRVRDHLNP